MSLDTDVKKEAEDLVIPKREQIVLAKFHPRCDELRQYFENSFESAVFTFEELNPTRDYTHLTDNHEDEEAIRYSDKPNESVVFYRKNGIIILLAQNAIESKKGVKEIVGYRLASYKDRTKESQIHYEKLDLLHDSFGPATVMPEQYILLRGIVDKLPKFINGNGGLSRLASTLASSVEKGRPKLSTFAVIDHVHPVCDSYRLGQQN
ncbi:hypothetical protein ACFLZ7_02595 [Nanoarchaeota archaeon]